ncbi:hypothetical protein B0H10DRAFT_2221980 [Mycena sp. CBHHK59/15]|nr:hypothetical protein B0H10DRAFT_2221980 [Mycena sp. CBHHK59/15]
MLRAAREAHDEAAAGSLSCTPRAPSVGPPTHTHSDALPLLRPHPPGTPHTPRRPPRPRDAQSHPVVCATPAVDSHEARRRRAPRAIHSPRAQAHIRAAGHDRSTAMQGALLSLHTALRQPRAAPRPDTRAPTPTPPTRCLRIGASGRCPARHAPCAAQQGVPPPTPQWAAKRAPRPHPAHPASLRGRAISGPHTHSERSRLRAARARRALSRSRIALLPVLT